MLRKSCARSQAHPSCARRRRMISSRRSIPAFRAWTSASEAARSSSLPLKADPPVGHDPNGDRESRPAGWQSAQRLQKLGRPDRMYQLPIRCPEAHLMHLASLLVQALQHGDDLAPLPCRACLLDQEPHAAIGRVNINENEIAGRAGEPLSRPKHVARDLDLMASIHQQLLLRLHESDIIAHDQNTGHFSLVNYSENRSFKITSW